MKEVKQLLKKYMEMARKSEYVSIGQVTNDLSQLLGELRIKRLPKSER
jgi:hypothetical protein